MTTKSIAQQVEERKRRGAAIVAADVSNVAQTSHHMYLVRGSEGNDYHVAFVDHPRCDCQDFQRNGATLGTCKHIEAARVFNAAWAMIERDGEQTTTLRAIVEASRGSELHRKRWEAVLSVLKYRAGVQSPAPVPMPPIVDLRDYYPTARHMAEMAVA